MVLFNAFHRQSTRRARGVVGVVLASSVFTACGESTAPIASGFLGGTATNHEIGVVVNSTGKSVTLFQLGSPSTQQQIEFGPSSTVTPTGFAVRGQKAVVPLGNAASVALLDLATASVTRHFLFESGNATGSAFVNNNTVIAANTDRNYVGRFTLDQVNDTISDTVHVAPKPTAVAIIGNRALVVSSNLDENYMPIGNGVVTVINPSNMQIIGTVSTGENPTDAAVGPDGLLYVVNTRDYVEQSSLTVINPSTLQVVTTVPNIGVGAGSINIDANGFAYISGYAIGTVVWNTNTRQFVRDADHPVCAPVTGGDCRGAFAATTSATGDLYQLFFGSSFQHLAPYVFVYQAGTFALTDSIAVGAGPAALAIRTF